MPTPTLTCFLKNMKTLVASWASPYTLWKTVPSFYKKDFKEWVGQYKQQKWNGMWEKGWYNYGMEYIAFLLDEKIHELEHLEEKREREYNEKTYSGSNS